MPMLRWADGLSLKSSDLSKVSKPEDSVESGFSFPDTPFLDIIMKGVSNQKRLWNFSIHHLLTNHFV